ncbi:hypothetical protein BOS5A_230205 [Bosea sp. EC-HK365B]|nr:hypothetical protein BOSE21B_90282 [Bosea sp. 21B]VVT60928.1 hypothetical protein BOS5A_230205 [Bosea sp. EC-HK365B]VXB36172.1 hypothetical protein BOSE127_110382 [Bosea sp. 127]
MKCSFTHFEVIEAKMLGNSQINSFTQFLPCNTPGCRGGMPNIGLGQRGTALQTEALPRFRYYLVISICC